MGRRRRKTKGRNGSGSVCRRKSDGRWMAVVSVRDESGKRRRVTRLAESEQHARLLLTELQNELLKRRVMPHASLAAVLSSWLESCQIAPATRASYELAANNHILPFFGEQMIGDIDALAIRKWHNWMKAKATGLRTQENAHAVLSVCMNDAVRLGTIRDNPCRYVKRPKPDTEEIMPFTEDETKRIIKATEENRIGCVYVMALRLGMRQGELFGLEWSHVDLQAGTLRIEQQAAEVNGKIHLRKPKTKASRRTLVLPDEVIEALNRRRIASLTEGLAGCEFVMPTNRGGVMRRSNFGQRHWKPLLDRLGIAHRGFHHTRHTAATAMLSRNVPVHQVAGILGHATASTTLDVYAHYVPRVVDSVVDSGVSSVSRSS